MQSKTFKYFAFLILFTMSLFHFFQVLLLGNHGSFFIALEILVVEGSLASPLLSLEKVEVDRYLGSSPPLAPHLPLQGLHPGQHSVPRNYLAHLGVVVHDFTSPTGLGNVIFLICEIEGHRFARIDRRGRS